MKVHCRWRGQERDNSLEEEAHIFADSEGVEEGCVLKDHAHSEVLFLLSLEVAEETMAWLTQDLNLSRVGREESSYVFDLMTWGWRMCR